MNNCEILCRLIQQEENRSFLMAIDGRCTSGKTTLAGQLQAGLECNVVHMDDFYLPFSKRTDEIMAQPGGNIDFDRLLSEVLLPLKTGQDARYRPYQCHEDCFLPTQKLNGAIPTIIEGSYSCHPRLRACYDLRVFLDIEPVLQRARLMARNPAAFEMFRSMWIPREEHYFTSLQIRSHCDLLLWGRSASGQ